MMRVTSIGSIAGQVIASDQEAALLGVTSRGVFLQAVSGWVLFLSTEAYRGPLTLNLAGTAGELHLLEPGDRVRIARSSLHFFRSGLSASAGEAEEWKPVPPPQAAFIPDAIRARLEAISQQILTEPSVFEAGSLNELREGLRERDAVRVICAAESLLGRGAGLTPSGDDLAAGLLLSLNRWRSCLPLDLPVAQINQGICAAAANKTTMLSANLITCAAQGQADERLIQALDGLITGVPGVNTCADLLRGWGSHSGCDAFTGMALALSAEYDGLPD